MSGRRLGILGGTFDPIHCGHVETAAAAVRALDLSGVFVIPASVPPHRSEPFGHVDVSRVTLVTIGNEHIFPAVQVHIEKDGAPGPF